MRVKTQTLHDFLENISSSSGVVDDIVWMDAIENPLDGDRRNAVKWLVEFHAYAVCQLGDGEFLLEMNIHCGIDYHDSSNEREGKRSLERLRDALIEQCNERGLTVRPGAVDMS